MKKVKKVLISFWVIIIGWFNKTLCAQMLYGVPREIREKGIEKKIEDLKRLDFIKRIDIVKNFSLIIIMAIIGVVVLINKKIGKKLKAIIIVILIIIGIIGLYLINTNIDSVKIAKRIYQNNGKEYVEFNKKDHFIGEQDIQEAEERYKEEKMTNRINVFKKIFFPCIVSVICLCIIFNKRISRNVKIISIFYFLIIGILGTYLLSTKVDTYSILKYLKKS